MQETIAFHIAALYKRFLKYSDTELKKLGITTGQLPFILYAGKHEGCSQSELTKNLRLDWGHSQRTVAKLVENGFMTKEHKESGVYNLNLTPAGQNVFKASHDLFTSWDEENLSPLSQEERKELLRLLMCLVNRR